jgi:hypothetical protein
MNLDFKGPWRQLNVLLLNREIIDSSYGSVEPWNAFGDWDTEKLSTVLATVNFRMM